MRILVPQPGAIAATSPAETLSTDAQSKPEERKPSGSLDDSTIVARLLEPRAIEPFELILDVMHEQSHVSLGGINAVP
jgi:hypothetical protein